MKFLHRLLDFLDEIDFINLLAIVNLLAAMLTLAYGLHFTAAGYVGIACVIKHYDR